MSAAVLQIREEGNAIIRTIAKREPAKVVSIKAAISPRHVYNLREEIGQPDLAWPNFIALAKEVPELRRKVMEWFEASQGENERDPAQVAAELVRLLQERDKGVTA